MTKLSKSAFLTKFNDAVDGLYKAGQVAGIGSDDHRSLVTDLKDSVIWPEDLANVRLMSNGPIPDYSYNYETNVITADADGVLEIDGVEVDDGDIILINSESDPRVNAVYGVTQAGDVSSPFILSRGQTGSQFNAIYFILEGDVNAGRIVSFNEDSAESVREVDKPGLIPSVFVNNCFSVPIDIITAPGANVVAIPTQIGFYMAFNSVPYATNTTIVIKYSSGAIILEDATDFLASAADKVVWYDIPIVEGKVNEAVQFSVKTGNPTAGNSTVRFVIKYRLVVIP